MNDSHMEAVAGALPQDALARESALKRYTTIKCGGPASLLLEARDEQEVAHALKLARQHNIPTLIVGKGSNLLIDDHGFDGLVIHFGEQFAQVTLEGTTLTAQAGASLMAVSRLAADQALSGLEFAIGIPASAGGAALMNCGAYGGEMSRVVTYVDCLSPEGEPVRLTRDEIGYGYRTSRMMREGYTVLSVTMELAPADFADIRQRIDENQAQRRERQPLTYPSAGSFFKRPAGHFAGALIEQAGLKGYRVGDAQVSELHAGFLINLGDATASDFLELVSHVQTTVEEMFGVRLEPEVRIIRAPEA